MRTKDLHDLPKVRDKWSFVYVEHCKIDQENTAIAIHDATGITPVPCAGIAMLILGPGVSITHAAVYALADTGCLILWCGEQGVRFYAAGMGQTRSAARILHQAALCTYPKTHFEVVRRMYAMRFDQPLDPALTLKQIRGMEGVRVRDAYAKASRDYGVPWQGRSYDRNNWNKSDSVNRALSAANACLYGICHAAIIAAGYSPALGFIHTGQQLSFVYDIADLYKTRITVPVAFAAVASAAAPIEREVRLQCRDTFARTGLLRDIVQDIEKVLDIEPEQDPGFDEDPTLPGSLWDPDLGTTPGGVQYADSDENPPDGPQEEKTNGCAHR